MTNQARAYRRLFSSWGWGGSDHAVHADPRVEREFAGLSKLDPGPDDVLLFHYSAYAPKLLEQLERPQRKVLVSHNITPAHWFWGHEPVTAVHCAIGREHLPRFAGAVDLALGVSQYNADELAEAGAARTGVVPILVDRTRLGEPSRQSELRGQSPQSGLRGQSPQSGLRGQSTDPPAAGARSARWLFVGRLVPHKRPDLVIRALALYRFEHGVDARLTWVGEPISPPYLASLSEFAEAVAPGAVTFESGLSADDLAARWRDADVFVCASEHEGFCIPILEAFHFGVPVVARAFGGIPEVAGDAALLLAPEDGLPVFAEAAHLAATDPALREEMQARGLVRLEEYAFDVTAAKLRAALESVAG